MCTYMNSKKCHKLNVGIAAVADKDEELHLHLHVIWLHSDIAWDSCKTAKAIGQTARWLRLMPLPLLLPCTERVDGMILANRSSV